MINPKRIPKIAWSKIIMCKNGALDVAASF